MKKHIVLILNIVLILAILSGVVFAMYRASQNIEPNVEATESTADEVATNDEAETTGEHYTIGIIQHSDIPNCNAAYQGFIAHLAQKGYVNQNTITLDYALEEDNKKCKEAIQRFIDSEYDLIYAIGPYATRLAASMTEDIPIVFGAVQEPEAEKFIKSNEVPGSNVTGVSDYTPCFEQIDSVKTLIPDAKKIGAIYYATDTDSVTQAIIGEKEAENIDVDYAKYPVESVEDIDKALQLMEKDGVDVIYAPIDKFINKNIDKIVAYQNENNIPIVCGNTTMLEKGCFSTCVINYSSIGIKAGDMVLDILENDADPAQMPIAYIYECYLHINADTLTALGVDISDEVKATAVIE